MTVRRNARRRRTRRNGTADDGSTLVLTIFYGVLALMLVLVVVAATSLYLERKRLLTLADGAALAAAEAFPLASVRAAPGEEHLRPVLSSADVEQAAEDYLAAVADDRFESLTLERAASVDGSGAEVSLSALWRPPVVAVVLPQGLRVSVSSVARSVFW
ncbi:pilus assembly protein TadG-related protein [Cryobacterium tepidiphilum]|nr:pilus assembly protein TadG-related protein [Cryobacterium tepidiphilum]